MSVLLQSEPWPATSEQFVTPGPDHTSPQGRYRPRTFAALVKDPHRPTRRHRRAFARATSGIAYVTALEFDATVCQFQGWRYSQTCDRCGGTCGSFDCSGLQCHVLDILGLGIGCLTSFVMANLCYDNGLGIDLSIARTLMSHWAYKGRNGGRSPGPNDEGHVVDGRGIINGRAETMEAMGRAYGCLIANWDGRDWAGASKIPGIAYVPPEPPFKVQPMFNPALDSIRAVLAHPQGKGTWIALDNAIVIFEPDPVSNPHAVRQNGGMVSAADRHAWGSRHVASLAHYTRKDGQPGYRIFATDGGKVGYVPAQGV